MKQNREKHKTKGTKQGTEKSKVIKNSCFKGEKKVK